MSQLQFHYVTIDDRELFNSFFKEKKVKSFDASFVNCFILAQEGNIQIATDDDALYVIQEWSGYYPLCSSLMLWMKVPTWFHVC